MKASDVKRTPSGRLSYRGETFSGFNKPKRSVKGNKKSAVLAKKGDEVKLVRFGDANMSIKKIILLEKVIIAQDQVVLRALKINFQLITGLEGHGTVRGVLDG